MNSTLATIFALGAACLGWAASCAHAAPASPAATTEPSAEDSSRFTVRAGAFLLSSVKTRLSLNGSDGQIGDEIDLERTLGAKDSLNVFRADAEWRFARRHKTQLSWFDINQTATHALETEIEWGDQVFPVDAIVDSQHRTTVYKVNYGYTFFRNDRHEIAALLGAHISELRAGLSAPNLGRAERVSITAPLPVLGLEWSARLTDHISSQVSYTYFGLSLDDRYSGNLSDFQALVDYHFGDHWSVSAGYNRYVMRSTLEAGPLELSVRHSYNGLMAMVSARF